MLGQDPPAEECNPIEKLSTEPATLEEYLEGLEQLLQDVLVILDNKRQEFTTELELIPILPGTWIRALNDNECAQVLLSLTAKLDEYVKKVEKKECLTLDELDAMRKLLIDAKILENIDCYTNALNSQNIAKNLIEFEKIVSPLKTGLFTLKEKVIFILLLLSKMFFS